MQFSVPSSYFVLSPHIPLSPIFSTPNPYPYRCVKGQVPRIFSAACTIRVVYISVPAVLNAWMVSVNFNMKVIFVR